MAAPRSPKERRSLSNVGGPVVRGGDPATAALLEQALDVPTSVEAEDAARSHVHGFHAYPARMHPLTARRLIESLSRPGDLVLDPFCGSGTVLVEARIAGRNAVGVDANPLAVLLARLKVRGSSPEHGARLIEAARAAAAFADARRKARAGATHRYGHEDMQLFQPHVLLELDGIRAGIDQLRDETARGDLDLVLSAILVKLSRQTTDTAEQGVERRLAAGYPARLFVRKTEELVARLAELDLALASAPGDPRDRAAPRVLEGDARELAGVADGSIALAVTSPPYPGNYDYLSHHAARLRWLRLPPDRFDRAEIGARRKLDPLGENAALARWRDDLVATLRALRRVLRSDGAAVLLIADSVVAGAPVYALDLLREVGPGAGLTPRAAASQARTHFHAGTARAFAERERREHAILLVVTDDAPRERPPRRVVGASGGRPVTGRRRC